MKQANAKYSILLIAGLGLAACDDNGDFEMPAFLSGGDESAASTATLSTPAVGGTERDVEAPEVFSVTDAALWDGRPSLGGVWVAHPDVTDPERVIIRNEANGQFVVGALFRRERENPGPSFQVSSDAAESLGMLAGSPAQLNVIALRREEGPAEGTLPEIASFDEPAAVTETPLDVPAAPDQAVDVAPVDTNDIAASAEAAIAVAAAAAAAQAANPPPVLRGPAPAAAPAPAEAPASSLDKPFIQIGIFSLETNAEATADRLRANGLSANVVSQNSQGSAFWRVIVGPAPTVADRSSVLEKVKGLGFTDAYTVTN